MHSSGSVLLSIIERVRYYIEEPVLDAKYDNDYMVRNVIMPEFVNVLSRLRQSMDGPFVVRHSISVTTTQEYYPLPPMVGEIWRVAQFEENTRRVIKDWRPNGVYNPSGPGWAIEGGGLAFRPYPHTAETWDIWYVPNGDFMPHYDATTGATLAADASSELKNVTLAQSPDLGVADLRDQAYAGARVRLIDTTTNYVIEEQEIETYDPTTLLAVTRNPFTLFGAGSSITYEVVPPSHQALWSAVAASRAMSLGAAKSVSEKKMKFLQLEYRKHFKTIVDDVSQRNLRSPKSWDKDTVDNIDGGMWWM